MKALVISDRQEIIDFVTPLLKEEGFDLIHYRWIIKALDNIEEIQPDVIVLSAGEYPRHWKTLAGFVQSGIGGNNVKVYLYETTPLSVEDSKKAEDLGVLSFIDDFQKINKKMIGISSTDYQKEAVLREVYQLIQNETNHVTFCTGRVLRHGGVDWWGSIEVKRELRKKIELLRVFVLKYQVYFSKTFFEE